MALFGRNKDEEEFDDEELIDEEKNDRKLTRKFRDLKPENKKKRKEPPKPWGKRERLMLLTIILATVIISGILTLTSENKKFFNFSGFNFRFPNVDLSSFNPFKAETITIKKGGNQ